MENGYLHQNGIDENSINGEAVAVAAEENIDARPQPNVQFLDNPNIHPATGNPGIPNNPIPQGEHIPQPQGNNQFGTVRDRLFHAMLVRFAISYNHHVSGFSRRLLEFSVLFFALSLLCLLFYVHFVFSKADNSCLKHLVDSWPRDGVMRIEVISNLEKFNEYQERISEKQRSQKESNASFTFFDLKKILMEGPNALPKELKAKHGETSKKTDHWTNFRLPEETLISLFLKSSKGVKRKLSVEEVHGDEEELLDFIEEDGFYGESLEALFEYVVEYSLHYGLLRLSHSYRVEHNIPFMLVRLDPETDSCFGDWFSRMLMKFFMGYEDVLMASVKALAENETEKGYLRDMITGEHYRFVTMASGNSSYLTATFVLLIFTFAISMLLRFSHHQIFLFIFDLLQMFEMNQALVFPAAPLLTVILALVGMEAIMSEVFNDTSTAFYVILLVWIADQYDAICCHSPISKRHWLRFFYLYHYAFYAYHYRYNGQYSGLALLTSSCFIMHSMIYFFHHYEMPLILYQERVQRIITGLQHNPSQQRANLGAEQTEGGETMSAQPAQIHWNNNNVPRQASERLILNQPSNVEINLGNRENLLDSTDEEMFSSSISTSTSASSSADFDERHESNLNNSGIDVNDPLLAAGERTAQYIIDSILDSSFVNNLTQ